MSTTVFNRADSHLTASLASIYGPVPVGTVAVIFHGTAANVDDAVRGLHMVKVQIQNGASVIQRLDNIVISYGSSAIMPKMVLKAGDSLYAVADVANTIDLSLDILEITG